MLTENDKFKIYLLPALRNLRKGSCFFRDDYLLITVILITEILIEKIFIEKISFVLSALLSYI